MFSGSIEKKKDLFTLNIQHIDALLPLVTVNIRLTINKIYDINSKNNPSPFIWDFFCSPSLSLKNKMFLNLIVVSVSSQKMY